MAGTAAGRRAIELTEEELEEFLAAQVKVQVATNGPDGVPHLVTMFYALVDGRIAFWTYGRSQKIRNLERDARLAVLVEGGSAYDELRGALIKGRAELVTDPDRIVEIGSAVATRMFGVASFDELGEAGAEEVRRQARKRVAVIVHPEHVASWDHSKMKG